MEGSWSAVDTLPKFPLVGRQVWRPRRSGRIHITYCKGTLHKRSNTELVQSVCMKLNSNWVKIKWEKMIMKGNIDAKIFEPKKNAVPSVGEKTWMNFSGRPPGRGFQGRTRLGQRVWETRRPLGTTQFWEFLERKLKCYTGNLYSWNIYIYIYIYTHIHTHKKRIFKSSCWFVVIFSPVCCNRFVKSYISKCLQFCLEYYKK